MICVENQQIIVNCSSSMHIYYKTMRHIQNVKSPFYGKMSQCFALHIYNIHLFLTHVVYIDLVIPL